VKVSNNLQAAEKWYLDLRLEVRNKGGHSSVPTADNAIYRLAQALVRVSQVEFPLKVSEVTRAYFGGQAKLDRTSEKDTLAAAAKGDPAAIERVAESSRSGIPCCVRPAWPPCWRADTRATRCRNLPRERELPGSSGRIVGRCAGEDQGGRGDAQVTISVTTREENSPASPLREDLVRTMSAVTDEMWPGVAVVPTLSTGATDGRMLRVAGIPTYGVQGFFGERDDYRAHGRDERMLVQSFYEGQTFLYSLVKKLSKAQ